MKICFWGDILNTLNGHTTGGGELQIILLAKILAAAGHKIVIVDVAALKTFSISNNITIVHIKNWNKGIKVLRTITHRLPGLFRTFNEQKADIYYGRIRDFRHIIPYLASRRQHAKFILGLASDLDIANFKTRLKYYYSVNFTVSKNKLWWFFEGVFTELIYPYLIRKSDLIFCQHSGQIQMLKQKGIKPVLFPNLINPEIVPPIKNHDGNEYIYVGSLDKRKGVRELFQIICQLPECNFKIVGTPRDRLGKVYYQKLFAFPNVKILGRLPHTETLQEIANSKALISTSPMEGFPNVFIEAWMCGTSVLSLYVNPGDVFNNQYLGYCAYGNIDKMTERMKKTIESEEFAKQAREYALKMHLISDLKIKSVDHIFRSICNK